MTRTRIQKLFVFLFYNRDNGENKIFFLRNKVVKEIKKIFQKEVAFY
jgi:hypothetical protein